MKSIRNSAPIAPIIVVTTHADQNSPRLEARVIDNLNLKYGNVCSYVSKRQSRNMKDFYSYLLF